MSSPIQPIGELHQGASTNNKINSSTSIHPPLQADVSVSEPVNLCFLEGLSSQVRTEVITAIIDSGAGMSTISEELARRKGLVLSPSNNLARLGDGSIISSSGSASVLFRFSNSAILSEECRLSLEAMGYNNSILISRHLLSGFGFRFFDSSDDDFGSWIITPKWRWYRLKIEGGATVCDFQLSVSEGAMMLEPITTLPEMHLDLSQALSALAPTGPAHTSDAFVLEGAAAQVYMEEIDRFGHVHDSSSCHVFYTCAVSPCCLTADGSVFQNAAAVKHNFQNYTRQHLHEVFGHVSDNHLTMLLHSGNDTLPHLTKKQRKISKCRCPSCLRGHHPKRRVPRFSKHFDSEHTYLTGESWNFDFGRFWADGDIEGFHTDATFVERNSRYAFAVLLKDHTTLWDAVQELRRFVREKCGVEVVHMHSDSDPNLRVNGAPSETYTVLRQKMSDAGIDVSFSPPHQHALNSWVENLRGRALHITNSILQHSYLSAQFRGRAYLHAIHILNVLPVPGSKHKPLMDGSVPWSLLRRTPPDYSLMVAPWGSSVMVKNIGTKSSQFKPCSDFGILMNISNGSPSWEIYIPDKQKFVTSTHIVVDDDMSKRLASLNKCDLLMKHHGPMSHTSKAYADGIRRLFASCPQLTPNLMVQHDPISGMPVKLVPFVDEDDNHYLIPESAADVITSAKYSNSYSESQTNINPDSHFPAASDSSSFSTPNAVDDVGSAFVHMLPQNRLFPVPKRQSLSKAEQSLLRNAPDDTILQYNEVNPKKPNSKCHRRYAQYCNCTTLGEYRAGRFPLADLYYDLSMGFLRVYAPSTARAGPASSFLQDPSTVNSIPHASVLQHFDSLPTMWKTICHTQRLANTIVDLERAAVEKVFNMSTCQLESTSPLSTPSSVERTMPSTVDRSDEHSIPFDTDSNDVTDHILHLCNLQPVTSDIPRCSSEHFLHTIANLSTDNYLRVENVLRNAEQRPTVSERDVLADELRHIYTTAGAGDILHGTTCNVSAVQHSEFPQTFKQAMKTSDKENWMKVALDEWLRFYNYFEAMVPASYDEYIAARRKYGSQVCSPIPMKWVFTVKRHASTGLYNRHKARLVAAQSLVRYSIDDKWSPTLSLDTMRLMLVLACLHDADISALDVSGAYLSGKLDPDDPPIFLMKPSGLDQLNQFPKLPNGDEPYCFRALSSCYGLQRACKLYLKSYFQFLTDFGLKQSSIDPCLWYRVDSSDNWILIGVYSDDNLIVSKGPIRQQFQDHFDSRYQESPDSGEVDTGVYEFLGLSVQKRKLANNIVEIEISSPKIYQKLRDVCGPTPSRFSKVPLVSHIPLQTPVSDDNPIIDVEVFNCRSVFGICLWACMAWRFDVQLACAKIASSLSKGNTTDNVAACKQLAWYLLESEVQSLKFSSLHLTPQFISFCDSSHGNDENTMRSWFSYVHIWANAAFGGRTKLGSAVCRSTKDSEMMAVIACLASILGYRFLLNEIGFPQSDPTAVHIDATAAIDQTTSLNVPKDQKFMAMRRRWVYNQFSDKLVQAYHCSTGYMLPDLNTKTHAVADHTRMSRNIQGFGDCRPVSTIDRNNTTR